MNVAFIDPLWHEVDVNLVVDDRGDAVSTALNRSTLPRRSSGKATAPNARAVAWVSTLSH
jgi:hypothetical protein